MRVLNPTAMRVEGDAIRGITAHIWQSGQFTRRYSPDQVIYAHTWSPTSDIGPGIAPLKIAETSAATALAAEQFTRAFFEQGALPPLVITPEEGALTDADAEALRTTWQRLTSGVRNAWRALVLRRSMQIKPLDIPALDKLAMSQVDEMALRRISAAFGVPVTMLTDAANYATAAEHRISFWRDTVLPDAELIAEALGLAVNYDDIEALAEDVGAQRKSVIDLYQAGLVTREEARQMLGFETEQPVDVATQSALRELDQWRRKSEARKTLLADFSPRDLPDSWVRAVKSLAELGHPPFAFARFVEAKARRVDPPLDREREQLAAQMLQVLEDSISLDDLSYDEQGFEKQARAYAESLLLAVAIDQATAAMLSSAAFADVERAYDFASRWAKDYSYELVHGINETTRKRLSELFTRSRAEGWTRNMLVDRIARMFGPQRAEMIATTEITRAYSQGTDIARQILDESGLSLVHVWRTAADERVCPICAPRDGREQGDGWDDLPPAHVRCRCWTTLEQPRRRRR
jgi:HK97 family phage portal protein